jgi:hypothetical protein
VVRANKLSQTTVLLMIAATDYCMHNTLLYSAQKYVCVLVAYLVLISMYDLLSICLLFFCLHDSYHYLGLLHNSTTRMPHERREAELRTLATTAV